MYLLFVPFGTWRMALELNPLNTWYSMLKGVSISDFTRENPLHIEKADSPIEVTELGIVNEPVNPLQFEKAPTPIVVTELGIVKEPVNPLQSKKAALPIEVTELRIINEPVNPLHP